MCVLQCIQARLLTECSELRRNICPRCRALSQRACLTRQNGVAVSPAGTAIAGCSPTEQSPRQHVFGGQRVSQPLPREQLLVESRLENDTISPKHASHGQRSGGNLRRPRRRPLGRRPPSAGGASHIAQRRRGECEARCRPSVSLVRSPWADIFVRAWSYCSRHPAALRENTTSGSARSQPLPHASPLGTAIRPAAKTICCFHLALPSNLSFSTLVCS